MAARANTTNSQGSGMSQVAGGNVATAQTFVTTYPLRTGSITVTRASQGASVGDAVERDSDGGLWDTVANVSVAPENTSIGIDDLNK